jgi:hypothetical protein
MLLARNGSEEMKEASSQSSNLRYRKLGTDVIEQLGNEIAYWTVVGGQALIPGPVYAIVRQASHSLGTTVE